MIQRLVSLPAKIAKFLQSEDLSKYTGALPDFIREESSYCGHDPEDFKLGSGGGTSHLLVEAWKHDQTKSENSLSFQNWLDQSQKLILHAGGKSKRLPAYAPIGKALIPIPLREETSNGRFQQTLIDLQMPALETSLQSATRSTDKKESTQPTALLSSGDVWLDFDPFSIPMIHRDLTGVGMKVSPKMATHFGVFIVEKSALHSASGIVPIVEFLQKPDEEILLNLDEKLTFYVDTGLWFLSKAAINYTLERCGWNTDEEKFTTENNLPNYLDFYADLCLEIGTKSKMLERANISSGFIPLKEANFYHMGTSLQLFESLREMQRDSSRERKCVYSSFTPQASPAGHTQENPIWLDSVFCEELPNCEGFNILNSIPKESDFQNFNRGECLDIVPLEQSQFCLRPYHVEDTFQGTIVDGTIAGIPAQNWLKARAIDISPAEIFEAKIYPILNANELNQKWLDWFFSKSPNPTLTKDYLNKSKISAAELANKINCKIYFDQKEEGAALSFAQIFKRLAKAYDPSLFHFDFNQFTSLYKQHEILLSPILDSVEIKPIPDPIHEARMNLFLDKIEKPQLKGSENSLTILQRGILKQLNVTRSTPLLSLKEDQIVWARSPVRLDLAGGWSDTPPYCLEHGGSVLNLSVNLNGQPPIQVFIKKRTDFKIKLRSIDLGTSLEISSFEDLGTYDNPQIPFSLPKACLCLFGLHPKFMNESSAESLEERLKELGGGIEISMLCAIPKGSGLGTSSILAATIAKALHKAFGLNIDSIGLYRYVLAVEQVTTTGGGWQDQAGAIWGGLKLIETQPEPSQTPTIRYLPEKCFAHYQIKPRILLYYTGITRLAKGILGEIVDGMILGSTDHLNKIGQIKENAYRTYEAFQKHDFEVAFKCIQTSWELNCKLDVGTNNLEVQSILEQVSPYLTSAKLLGAGGGGYLLMIAKDSSSSEKIRLSLEQSPPNSRARFVEIDLSNEGLQVSVS